MPETYRLTTRSVWENAAPSATGSRRGTPGASLVRRLNPQVRNMGSRLCSLAGRLRCAAHRPGRADLLDNMLGAFRSQTSTSSHGCEGVSSSPEFPTGLADLQRDETVE